MSRPPLVKGGQGRTNGSVRSDARVILTMLAVVAVIACALFAGGCLR